MVRHWWKVRKKNKEWWHKILINGIGLILTLFILISVTIIKFTDGGWITLFITGSLAICMILIKNNYMYIRKLVRNMDNLVAKVEHEPQILNIPHACEDLAKCSVDHNERTAVIFVKNYNGVGIKTLYYLFKSFGSGFKNYIIVQLGLIDAGAMKSQEEVDKVKAKVEKEVHCYVSLLNKFGYHAEAFTLFGTDTVEEVSQAALEIQKKYPNSTFFGGQIIFDDNSLLTRILHNYTLFSMQRRLYEHGIPLYILPIELSPSLK